MIVDFKIWFDNGSKNEKIILHSEVSFVLKSIFFIETLNINNSFFLIDDNEC